jgi:K+-sensing histidine kinase KdpD
VSEKVSVHPSVPERAPLYAYVIGLLGIAASSLAIGLLNQLAYVPGAIMLHLPPILFVGGRWGTAPAVVAAAASFVAHAAFHLEPFGAGWPLHETSDFLDLMLLLVVAVVTGRLAASARQAARRARDSELRATLLASISHDLRTPLTAIKTSVSSLRDPSIELPDATRHDLLTSIEEESDRLVYLVTNVLMLSRLEAGVEPTRDWNAIGEVVSAVVARCTPLLGDRPIALDAPDTLPLVRIDAALLDQALSNLLENIGLHTPARTPVSVRAAVQGRDVRVEVTDGGPGIPPDQQQQVFERFHRVGCRQAPGVGLGLTIARSATEAQGGRLWLEDAPGGGARFIILLPNAVQA